MTERRTPAPEEVLALLREALRRPAQDGARLMALHWLHELLAAREAWHRHALTERTEALHKARVALRRLRATAKENKRVLDGAFDGKIARALRSLGQATNAVRDTDVQRGWLEAEQDALPDGARHEATLLLERLTQTSNDDAAQVEAAFERHLDAIAERLVERLSSYAVVRRVGLDTTPLPFARHLATRIERAGTRLLRDIDRITDVHADEAMHAVRIRLKRQRALLSPFAGSRPAIGAWFDLATRGQDLLGALRDADLLARRAEQAGLSALASALREIVLAHYAAFQHDWCARIDEVQHTLDTAVSSLRAEGTPLSSAGLPMEIERKFLLRACPPAISALAPVRIEQGWIPGQALRERVRRRYAPDGSVSCWRTMKLGPAEARIEVEEAMPDELFEAMWPLTRHARIRKDRYAVVHGPQTWEIDVFLDRELILAEVELGDVDETVNLPPWLAPYVEREVTGDPAYHNVVLARPE